MTPAALLAGAPLIALGLGAVAAMLLAPVAGSRVVRMAAGLSLAAALSASLMRVGAPATTAVLMVEDGMTRFGQTLVCLTGLAALAFLRPAPPAREAPALLLIATLGASLLSGASHAATLFLGLELVTLSLIAMFVLPTTHAALEAGYKLLILGGIGAATLLLALALAYAATGTLALDGWSGGGMMVSLGAALLLSGISFKFALAPFHMWTPDAFSGAPAAAAAFAGTAAKIGVAVVLLRLDAVGPPDPVWSLGLALVGSASILLGNLQALRQTSAPRMLGYSSIAHSGYVAVIVAAGAGFGADAVLFYLASYAPALVAALCVAALLGGDCRLDDLRGLIWRRPTAGAAFAISMLSLAGLPAAVGFFGKFYLFDALIRAQAWGLLAVAIVGSALGVYVYARFATIVFRQGSNLPTLGLPWPDAVVLTLCVAAILGFGVYPGPLIAAVRLAAS